MTVEIAPNVRIDVIRSTITDKYVDVRRPGEPGQEPAASAGGGMFGKFLGKK